MTDSAIAAPTGKVADGVRRIEIRSVGSTVAAPLVKGNTLIVEVFVVGSAGFALGAEINIGSKQ
jgi:hypothetical protein